MILEHMAIWAKDLEDLKQYYIQYFGAMPNDLYHNPNTGLKTYFLRFEGGARLEIMQMPGIAGHRNEDSKLQYFGLAHLAFAVQSKEAVDLKASELKDAGYNILRGPRITGDGYYEFETLDPEGNRIEVTCSMGDHE
ncbi:MAG: VOC family protein [Cyclobacteriaceae bacterium]|nr:VOC family protein [Cyclobacteriaceae bacterium]